MDQDIQFTIDAFPPPKMAERAEDIGVTKAKMDFWTMFGLAVLAGAFIGMGAMFATTVTAGAEGNLYFGMTRLLMGVAFSLGLILVIVGGAELFTGNNLIVMAFISRKVTIRQLLRNWAVVYIGNFVGSIATVVIIILVAGTDLVMGSSGSMPSTSPRASVSGLLSIWWPWGSCAMPWSVLPYGSGSLRGPRRTRSWRSSRRLRPSLQPGLSTVLQTCISSPPALPLNTGGRRVFLPLVGKTLSDYPDLTWYNFFFVNLFR